MNYAQQDKATKKRFPREERKIKKERKIELFFKRLLKLHSSVRSVSVFESMVLAKTEKDGKRELYLNKPQCTATAVVT